jgi:hypothetical protein
MIKLPEQFAALRDRNKPLDESVGKRLAMWSTGSPTLVKTADDNRTFTASESTSDDESAGQEERQDTVTDDAPNAEEGPADEQRGDGDADAEARQWVADYITAVKDAKNPKELEAAQKGGNLGAARIRSEFPDLYAEIDPYRPADAPERNAGLFGEQG